MENIQITKNNRITLIPVAILIVVIWGFYRTYLVFFPSFEGFQFTQHFHGAAMFLWLGLLIVQPLLVSREKYDLHRAIGKASYVLAPVVVLSIFLVSRMTYYNVINNSAPIQEALAAMALSIPSLIIFGVLYGLAMANKRKTYNHMRYMIGTAILMIGPGLGRGLIIYFDVPFPVAVSVTLVVAVGIGGILMLVDLIKKRNYVPYLVVTAMMLIQSGAWELRYGNVWQAAGKAFSTWFF